MKIQFTKDYVNKKKGNVHDFDTRLAKQLIKEGVAKEIKIKGRPKKKKEDK